MANKWKTPLLISNVHNTRRDWIITIRFVTLAAGVFDGHIWALAAWLAAGRRKQACHPSSFSPTNNPNLWRFVGYILCTSFFFCLSHSHSFFIIGALPVIYSLNRSPRKVKFLVQHSDGRISCVQDGLECHQSLSLVFYKTRNQSYYRFVSGLAFSLTCNSIWAMEFETIITIMCRYICIYIIIRPPLFISPFFLRRLT